jgi:hypothetical protein
MKEDKFSLYVGFSSFCRITIPELADGDHDGLFPSKGK